MPEEQITSCGGESINVASLKITTILSQQMARWQYNALLTLYQGHQAFVPFYPPERKKKNLPPHPKPLNLRAILHQEELLLFPPLLLRYVL